MRAGRPLITLKLATSLDGRIATRSGASRWITGEEARQRAHHLRATHDAIMIGSGTALADDPELTCRLPGLEERSPVRIVLDGRLRMAPSRRLARTARKVPTWVITRADAEAKRRAALERAGVEVLTVATATAGAHRPGPGTGRPGRRAGSRGSWWRAAASSRRRCCAPVWSTGWSGSTRRS